jgi:hypothetical protein
MNMQQIEAAVLAVLALLRALIPVEVIHKAVESLSDVQRSVLQTVGIVIPEEAPPYVPTPAELAAQAQEAAINAEVARRMAALSVPVGGDSVHSGEGLSEGPADNAPPVTAEAFPQDSALSD